MKRLIPVCRVYLLVILLAATVLSPFPYSLAAIVLLAAIAYSAARPVPPRLKIGLSVCAIVLTPLAAEPVLSYWASSPVVRQGLAAILMLPALFLLDSSLLQNAGRQFDSERNRRDLTPTARALLTTFMVILILALVIDNLTLLFADTIFGIYLIDTSAVTFFTIPGEPINLPGVWRRTIAGTDVSLSLLARNNAPMILHCLLSPEDKWVKITPRHFTVERNMSLDVHFTPPLAGPSRPKMHLATIDPRGFVQRNQVLEPVELHVIPRAKFAEWLAHQFLEQSGTWTAVPLSLMPEVRLPKRGTDYYGSRSYQPSDMLKDIDWKHTLKLNRLTIKEYIETSERVFIIAANLAVSNPEEADKLAGNLVGAALTLAQENIPAALAAYDTKQVIETTPVLEPREILHRALALVKAISIVDFTPRVLQPTDVTRLRRDINQLKQVSSEPAKRLLNMLQFEYEAIRKSAEKHPAALALTSVTEHTPAPATIIVISEMNHDSEALALTLEKLARQDFTRITVRR